MYRPILHQQNLKYLLWNQKPSSQLSRTTVSAKHAETEKCESLKNNNVSYIKRELKTRGWWIHSHYIKNVNSVTSQPCALHTKSQAGERFTILNTCPSDDMNMKHKTRWIQKPKSYSILSRLTNGQSWSNHGQPPESCTETGRSRNQ